MKPLALAPRHAERLRTSHWRILITGATGWLGQASLELLANALGEGWRERVLAFGSGSRTWRLRNGTEVEQQALADMPALSHAPSLLLHFAYLTREKAPSMAPRDYIEINRRLSRLAAEGGAKIGVERAFVTSSGATHAALDAVDAVDAVDDADPGLLYGKLKLEDEALFERFAGDKPARRAFVARLFNLSGPYINKLDSYALASFIRQARSGCLQIRARHPVIRSYTSASNLLGVAMGQLLSDDAPRFQCVETAGDQEVEVGELAKMVCDVVSPNARIERNECAKQPIDRYVGNGRDYRLLLGEHGIVEHRLQRQIADTAEYLAQLEIGRP